MRNKKSSKAPSEEKLLTDVELELMQIIWSRREASVNEVLLNLPKERSLAYTSVSTILRILEQKSFLKTRKEGRGHIYIPTISKQDYEARSLKQLVEKVFDGTASAVIRRLIDTDQLTEKDLQEIKSILNERH